MTGLPQWNFPAFHAMAQRLRVIGLEVFNPADTAGGDTSHPRSLYMRKDVEGLLKCDCVVLLDGWRKSKGALLEVAIAEELGITILDSELKILEEETILEEADRLVSHDRQDNYGHPFDDFTKSGRIMGAILEIPDVPPEKVALVMIGIKLSREVHKPKRDNLVDICGYSKTAKMVLDKKAENGLQ